MHSNSKPAGDSDLKPATLGVIAWVVLMMLFRLSKVKRRADLDRIAFSS